MDYSPPGSSVHGVYQGRILEWVTISSSRESSWPKDQTHVSCSGKRFFPFYLFIYLFLNEEELLYNTVLVSAIHQHAPAICIYTSPPSWVSLHPPTPSHFSSWSQSPGLSPLPHTANFHWLSILHMVAYMFPCYSLHLSHPLLPPTLCPQVCTLCLCLHCCLQIRPSVPSFQIPDICFNICYLFFSFWPTSLCVTSTSLELTQKCSFLWLSSIPKTSLSIHPSMDI